MIGVTWLTESEVIRMNCKSKILVFLLLAGSAAPVILTAWLK